ncbi:MAG: HAMP domain-containing sensor histidine kinase [Candidatus Sulfotelmatobacter sp.]
MSSLQWERMSLFQRYRWFVLAGGITLAFALVSLAFPRGPALAAVFDVGYLLLMLVASVAMLATAWAEQGINRRFWLLMSAGFFLWACDAGAWNYYEVIRHAPVPRQWFMNVVLFLHFVPMIAAVGLRPHRCEREPRFRGGTLEFLLLLLWWVFLYAFIVFPPQYVSLDPALYERNSAALYLAETGVFVVVLGIAARGATAGWRLVYLNLMAASTLYALDSQGLSLAMSTGRYYSGSLYDVPLIGTICWLGATALNSPQWHPEPAPVQDNDRWGAVVLRMATLAILSLPVLGLWTFLLDRSPVRSRIFRLFAVLTAMLALGVFLFVRQYLQDRALIRLLNQSRSSFENEQRLQSHLVQREKLASLGQLVAGAAHEIDQPLTAIMDYSEKLWSHQRLAPEQDALVRKIVSHSQRTRDLIANLLSFAQQGSAAKQMVDVSVLLQRSVQMRDLQLHEANIHIETTIDMHLPQVWGDGHQLFQAFVHIVENALDALEDAGGGTLRVTAQREKDQIMLQFSDSGPGIKEPHRVFDPFYTTKPIGKGTGLGLSAVYGVVQDHQGQIWCHNKPEGGALFVLRLPVAAESVAQVAGAGGD